MHFLGVIASTKDKLLELIKAVEKAIGEENYQQLDEASTQLSLKVNLVVLSIDTFKIRLFQSSYCMLTLYLADQTLKDNLHYISIFLLFLFFLSFALSYIWQDLI